METFSKGGWKGRLKGVGSGVGEVFSRTIAGVNVVKGAYVAVTKAVDVTVGEGGIVGGVCKGVGSGVAVVQPLSKLIRRTSQIVRRVTFAPRTEVPRFP
jgi:hypothetical protein